MTDLCKCDASKFLPKPRECWRNCAKYFLTKEIELIRPELIIFLSQAKDEFRKASTSLWQVNPLQSRFGMCRRGEIQIPFYRNEASGHKHTRKKFIQSARSIELCRRDTKNPPKSRVCW